MFIPKKYGQSQIKTCPWCQGVSLTENYQKVPVCLKHRDNYFENVKCSCGKFIDLMHGKFGSFFTCINCGIISMKKALEVNQLNDITKVERNQKNKSNQVFNRKANNDDMLDLLSSIRTNKKSENQIMKECSVKSQQNAVKKEKIPTLFEMLDADENEKEIKKENKYQMKTEKESFDKNNYNKKEIIVSSDELDFM